MNEIALFVSGFSLSIDGRKVLHDIDLQIPKNSLALVVGPRWSGKSALLRSFLRLNREIFASVSFTGSIMLQGRDLDSYDIKELRNKVAYTDSSFLGSIRQFTMIEFFRLTKGRRFALADFTDEELDLFDKMDATDLLNKDPKTLIDSLSSFQRLILLILSVVFRKPDVVIFDNVLDHLDDELIRTLKDILAARKNSHTIIVSSRSYSRLLEISDLMIILQDGRIQYNGTPFDFVLQDLAMNK